MVLFPGTVELLHVFEPRYRAMLADCLASDRRFGVVCCPPGVPEAELPVRTVGCIAVIESATQLADGRSNIAVRGGDRFVFAGYAASDAAYRVGHADAFADEMEPSEGLPELCERLKAVFGRAVRAMRTIQDDQMPVPDVPASASLLSFAIAQQVELPLHDRQAVLSRRTARARLETLESVLHATVLQLEARAALHQRAYTNGHSHH